MKNFLLKINDWIITHTPQDKLLHFIAGGLVQFMLLAVLVLTGSMFYFGLFACLSVIGTFVVSLIKEALDSKWKGEEMDANDMTATTVGGTVSLIMILLTKFLFV